MPRAAPFVRGTYQVTGLFFVLISIPLAFDVGGTDCGISFTYMLSLFYFTLCTLRLLFNRTRLRLAANALYNFQFIIIPSMLLLHLSRCSLPPSSGTINQGCFNDLMDSIITKLSWPWRMGLDYATGPFAILEGFCALIVIQSCGRAATSVARKSDTFLYLQLVLASLMISADIYLLIRIYSIPDIVGVATATLIGAALTVCLSLGIYAIWSRKGGVMESTLLFSYVVYQIYLAFTDFQNDNNALVPSAESVIFASKGAVIGKNLISRPWDFLKSAALSGPASSASSLYGNSLSNMLNHGNNNLWPSHLLDLQLPPIILESYSELMKSLAKLTPAGIRTMLDYLLAALTSITPSVCISLVVRLTAYFVAMRLVPYIRHDPQHSQTYSKIEPSQKLSRWVVFAYAYSPILIIMVYTHLLLQHGNQIVHAPRDAPSLMPLDISKIWTNSRQAWQFWGWANVFSVLGLYGLELTITPADNVTTPTGNDDDTLMMNI